MIEPGYTPPPALNRVRNGALIAGLLFSVVFGAGLFIDRPQFFHSYLVGYQRLDHLDRVL